MDRILTAFDSETTDLNWRVVNDNVMGGRSTGGFLMRDDILQFSGSTNTNGGGFSSIRSAPGSVTLSQADGVQLKVMGDGRTYTFRIATQQGVSYWADFATSDGDNWEIVKIPFSSFRARWRGMRLPAPQLSAKIVDSLGLMIYDKLDGDFRLMVDRISTY